MPASGGGGTNPQFRSEVAKQLVVIAKESQTTEAIQILNRLSRKQSLLAMSKSFCFLNKVCKLGIPARQSLYKTTTTKPTPSLPNKGGSKVAFTLAEVLITLGIIGVVAALTMPSLIAKYQMKTFEVALKKQYAVFQDAINFISLEDSITECSVYYHSGDIGYSLRRTDCQRLREALIERLGLSPIKYDYPYAEKTEILAGGGKSLNAACSTDDGFKRTIPYITKDGAIVLIHNRDAYMTIDVNGKKGPNKWGYDVFYFTLTTNNSADRILLTDELCSIIEKGGRFPRTILRNQEQNTDTNIFWK